MPSIVYRNVKGSRLTSAEGDENNRILLSGERLQIPKEQGNGLRIGPDNDLTFGWADLPCNLTIIEGLPTSPTWEVYKGGIKQRLFRENDEIQLSAHLNHDYAMATNIFIHAHWSHNSPQVTGGSVTWGFELMYAKGHQQMAFTTPIFITEFQAADTTPEWHMICEAPASIGGGSANLLDTSLLEVDGLVQGRAFLVANNLTYSGAEQPGIFLHQIDIHYQSTGAPTKNRAPNFWG